MQTFQLRKVLVRQVLSIVSVECIIINIPCKVGCVFPMVVVSIKLQVELGSNDHREDASHLTLK